jgi:hypothetical protein
MAISGIGKSAERGLLSQTLNQMNVPKKAAEPQLAKAAPQVKTASAMNQQVPATIDQVPTKRQSDQTAAKALPTVGLDIKA